MDMTTLAGYLLGLLGVEDTDRYSMAEVALNTEMRELCRLHSTRYNWVTATWALTGGSDTVALPARWKRTDRAWYIAPASTEQVTLYHYRSLAELDADWPPSTAADVPLGFAISGPNAIMRPAPAVSMNLTHEYWELPGTLTKAGTNALLDDYWELIMYRAAANHGTLWIQEDERMGVFRDVAQKLEISYVAATRHDAGDERRFGHEPGRITPQRMRGY